MLNAQQHGCQIEVSKTVLSYAGFVWVILQSKQESSLKYKDVTHQGWKPFDRKFT